MSQNRNISIKVMKLVFATAFTCKQPKGSFRDMICNTLQHSQMHRKLKDTEVK